MKVHIRVRGEPWKRAKTERDRFGWCWECDVVWPCETYVQGMAEADEYMTGGRMAQASKDGRVAKWAVSKERLLENPGHCIVERESIVERDGGRRLRLELRNPQEYQIWPYGGRWQKVWKMKR